MDHLYGSGLTPPAVQGLAQVTHGGTGSTTYTANAPTGIVAGEILFCQIYVRTASAITISTTPTGWNQIINTTGAGGTTLGYWKLATGSEPASYSWVGTVSGVNSQAIIRISAADTTTPSNASNATAEGASSTTHTFPSISPAVTDTLMICGVGGIGIETFGTWTGALAEQWDGNAGNAGSARTTSGATEALAASGASGTRQTTSSATEQGVNTSVAIAPGAAAASLLIPTDNVYRILSRR